MIEETQLQTLPVYLRATFDHLDLSFCLVNIHDDYYFEIGRRSNRKPRPAISEHHNYSCMSEQPCTRMGLEAPTIDLTVIEYPRVLGSRHQ